MVSIPHIEGKTTPLIQVISVVTEVYDLGAVVGSLLCIFYGEKIGCRRTIFIGLILAIVVFAIESSAFSLAQFIVGRILVGGAIDTISAAVPVWQSECAGTAHRGSFVVLEGLCISGGITISEWVSFGLYLAITNSANWRVPIVLPVVFALFALLRCHSYSPCRNHQAGLSRAGRVDEARRVLVALKDEDKNSRAIDADMAAREISLSEVRRKMIDLTKNGRERIL